jgi:DNA-binding SARP family transcriptional activator
MVDRADTHRSYERGWDTESARVSLKLLGGFDIVAGGRPVRLPLSAQRVLVALALHPGTQDRTVLAARLYPDARRRQVQGSLRSALWRAKGECGLDLVESQGQRLGLAAGVEVDIRSLARRVRSLETCPSDEPMETSSDDVVDALSQELMPTWDDDWLVLERERWRQLRLHALELMASRLVASGRHTEAVQAGLVAVSIEPYRESAHRAVIAAHIAEGNGASALAQYQRYQRALNRELGLRPTPQIQALIQGLADE